MEEAVSDEERRHKINRPNEQTNKTINRTGIVSQLLHSTLDALVCDRRQRMKRVGVTTPAIAPHSVENTLLGKKTANAFDTL